MTDPFALLHLMLVVMGEAASGSSRFQKFSERSECLEITRTERLGELTQMLTARLRISRTTTARRFRPFGIE